MSSTASSNEQAPVTILESKRKHLKVDLVVLEANIAAYIAKTDAYRPRVSVVVSGRLGEGRQFTPYREAINIDRENVKDMFTTCHLKLYNSKVFQSGPPDISYFSLVSETEIHHSSIKNFRNPLPQDLASFNVNLFLVKLYAGMHTEELILLISLPEKWTFEAFLELHRRAFQDWVKNGPDADYPADGKYARRIRDNVTLWRSNDWKYDIYQYGGKTVLGALAEKKLKLQLTSGL